MPIKPSNHQDILIWVVPRLGTLIGTVLMALSVALILYLGYQETKKPPCPALAPDGQRCIYRDGHASCHSTPSRYFSEAGYFQDNDVTRAKCWE